jgi:DNA-binding MarR family transcriptional regulator
MSEAQEIDAATCAEAARICACFNVRRTARAVTRLFDASLQPSGLRSTQFVILVAIRASGEPTLPALARALGVERSTLTRNLSGLERDGFVERVAGSGGRESTVRLTAAGLRKLGEGVPLWHRAQSTFVGNVKSVDWEKMLSLLGDITAAAERST